MKYTHGARGACRDWAPVQKQHSSSDTTFVLALPLCRRVVSKDVVNGPNNFVHALQIIQRTHTHTKS